MTLPEMPWFRMLVSFQAGLVLGVAGTLLVIRWLSRRPALDADMDHAASVAFPRKRD